MSLDIFLIDFENVQPASVGRLVPGTCKIKLFLGQNQTRMPVELGRALLPFGSDVEFLSISGNGPNAVDFHIAFYIGHMAPAHPGATFHIVSRDTGFDPLVLHLSRTCRIACKRITALPGDVPKKASSTAPAKKAATPVPTSATKSPQAGVTGAKAESSKPALPQRSPPTKIAKKAAPAKAAPAKKAKNVQVTVLPAPAAKAALPKSATADVVEFTEKVIERLKGLKAAKPATLKTLTSSLTSWARQAPGAPAVAQVLASLVDRKLIAVEGTKVSYRLK